MYRPSWPVAPNTVAVCPEERLEEAYRKTYLYAYLREMTCRFRQSVDQYASNLAAVLLTCRPRLSGWACLFS